MKMMKILCFFGLFFSLLPLLGLTVAGQEEAIAVSVSIKKLPLVSSSVVAAESWLKSEVLAHYPTTNISTILVGSGILCNRKFESQWSLVLSSVRNLYFNLIRWGLVKEIRVSAVFSSSCFEIGEAQMELEPLLRFLQESSSPYTIHQMHVERLNLYWIMDFEMMKQSEPTKAKLSAHQDFLKRLGFSRIRDIRMMSGAKPMKRKLSSLDSPSFSSRRSNPPPFHFAPVPGSSFSFAPESSPDVIPAAPNTASGSPLPFVVPTSPPFVPVPVESPLTYCIPPVSVPAPGQGEGEKVGLWCVAKPTVPEEKLQEAMDFACGEGGADCEEIRPNGNCFNPDNSVAHASYAFNSYWQKTKQSGGSCNFDGTAILINSDPSFLHCRFELS